MYVRIEVGPARTAGRWRCSESILEVDGRRLGLRD